MDHVSCTCCNQTVVPNAPDRGYWALIATFWVFSILFGLGAVNGVGYGFTLLISWALIATTAGVLVQHATSWTCPECASTLPPPDDVIVYTRLMNQERHAHAHTHTHA